MVTYPQRIVKTPGGKGVSVGVINRKYEVKGITHRNIIPLLDESGVKFLAECITERINHKRDCPILVTGDRGIGKSTVTIKTARTIEPGLSVSKIAFRLEEFEKIFQENPYGDGTIGQYPQVLMDEAGHALYGPEWLAKEQRVIAKQLIISRIKRQIIWMTVPKRMQFNNQLRNMAAIWVHIAEPQEFVQGYALVRMAPAHLQSEWHTDKYWEPKFAFIFTAEQGDFWNEYERKKIAFVNEITAETSNARAKRQEELTVKIAKKLAARGMIQEEIGQILEKDRTTISHYLSISNST